MLRSQQVSGQNPRATPPPLPRPHSPAHSSDSSGNPKWRDRREAPRVQNLKETLALGHARAGTAQGSGVLLSSLLNNKKEFLSAFDP